MNSSEMKLEQIQHGDSSLHHNVMLRWIYAVTSLLLCRHSFKPWSRNTHGTYAVIWLLYLLFIVVYSHSCPKLQNSELKQIIPFFFITADPRLTN